MFRHVPEPLHARGFEADVGIEAASDSAVDDGLLLLLQQLDHLLLSQDVPPNPPIHIIKKPHDRDLFVNGRKARMNSLEVLWP